MIQSKEQWDSLTVLERVGKCHAVGLSGTVASKAWENLSADEKLALSGIGVLLRLLGREDGLVSFENQNEDRIQELVERNKPLVQNILAKYLSGTRSGNGSNG